MNGALVVLGFLLIPMTAVGNPKKQHPPAPPGSIGHGKGTAGRTKLPLPAPGGSGSPTSVLALASWLDDADTLAPGAGSIGIAVSHSDSLDGGETDAPVLDAAVGLSSRVQLSGSLPYYQASYSDGYESSGLGNTYLAVKVKVVDPNEHTVGLAVAPVLEILGDASLADPTLGLSRVNWALPISVQVGRGNTRAFATAGYFSRGALFLAAALEHALSSKFTLTGAVSHMYATSTTDGSDLQGLSRSRTDLTGSVAWRVAPALSVAAGLGRTVSSLDQNGTTLLASASISYSITARKRPQP
jgi:hypothetical protein